MRRFYTHALLSALLALSLHPWAVASPILPPQSLIAVETQTDPEYWLDSTYAMTGSALGHTAVLLTILTLDLLPDALAKTGETPADLVNGNVLLGFLLVVPVLTTAFALQWFAPKSEHLSTDFGQTLIGSALGALLHVAILIPMVLLLPHGSTTQQTVYDLAPIGILTGVLLEGLMAAHFYGRSKQWQIQQSQGGVLLVHRIPF